VTKFNESYDDVKNIKYIFSIFKKCFSMHFYIGLAWVSIIMKEKGGLRAHSTARPRSLPTKVLLEDENKKTKRQNETPKRSLRKWIDQIQRRTRDDIEWQLRISKEIEIERKNSNG
jgi:hypothetical protein